MPLVAWKALDYKVEIKLEFVPMPRANLTSCFQEQRTLRDKLLFLGEGRLVVKMIRDTLAEGHVGLKPQQLSELLQVPASDLVAQIAPRRHKQKPRSSTLIPEQDALEVLRRYIPKVLGWRSVADFSKELGEHRNTVVSVIKKFGTPDMALIAPDHRMYISRQGERLVRRKHKELSRFSSWASLANVAKELGIGSNLARSFFSNRRIPLNRDLAGKYRLSPEQVEDLVRWRTLINGWREGHDIVLAGNKYRPIQSVAREKADILEPRGTPCHSARVSREEGTLRYFRGVIERPNRSDMLSQYVSRDLAEVFVNTISAAEAARLVSVRRGTIKMWRRRYPGLRPARIPGKKTQGICLPKLLKLAEEKYELEPKLKKKLTRPVALLALTLQGIALRAGVRYDALVEVLPVPKPVKEAMCLKRGDISVPHFEKLRARLEGDADVKNSSQSFMGAVRYLTRLFKPSCPVAAASEVQCAVELAAMNRGISRHAVYSAALELCRLQDVWPQSYEELRAGRKGELLFPLIFIAYLNALADPSRRILVEGKIPRGIRPKVGDIFAQPESRDFGLIVEAHSGSTGPWIVVEFCRQGMVRISGQIS